MTKSRLRRFSLVATTVTGVLFLLSMPFGAPHSRLYPIVGLVAAIASAGVTWSPRIVGTALGRIVQAACLSVGLLVFLALARHDLAPGSDVDAGMMWVIIGWLIALGVIGQLLIVGCRPREIYLGLLAAFAVIAGFSPSQRHSWGQVVGGSAIMAILPLITALITRYCRRRFARAPHADLPTVRALAGTRDSVP